MSYFENIEINCDYAPFFSTLFVTSYVNVSFPDSNNNNSYRTSNLLISYGGGGGGGSNFSRTKAKDRAKLLFKKRLAKKKAAKAIPLTEDEKKLLYFN